MNVENKTNKQLRRMAVNHWKRMLKLSIDDIREGKEAPTSENCAFCEVYALPKNIDNGTPCRGCPVWIKTGKPGCLGTPYYEAACLYNKIRSEKSKRIKDFRTEVQKEIEFLESLEV